MQTTCPATDRYLSIQQQRPTHPLLPSLNHLRYDESTYLTDLGQSRGPGSYILETPTPHCKPCFANDAMLKMGTSGHRECEDRLLIDVDSELLGITRKASRTPACQNVAPVCAASVKVPDCTDNSMLPVQDTRLNNPPSTLRGTGWNRWQWLCRNPQEHAIIGFETLVDTSILTKDNHRPMICTPLDQTVFLPPRKYEDPARGAPKWQPDCPKMDGPYDPNAFTNPIPSMHWRSCEEIAKIQNGTIARGYPKAV